MALFLKPVGAGHASSAPFPIPVIGGSVSVGRHESNDMLVTHSAVSGRHARLETNDAGIELVDCESSHGTFVNGERIMTRLIGAGDRIRFATAEFEVSLSGNGSTSVSDKISLKTTAIPLIAGSGEVKMEVSELQSQLSSRDETIESLQESLEEAKNERDDARKKLEPIEAIWDEFGADAQAELKSRCDKLMTREKELKEKADSEKTEIDGISTNLEQLRSELEEEIRRAQRLSRRGTESESQERISSAAIALDAEQEAYRALIGRIETFDQMIDGYRRSKRFRDIAGELEEFRDKLFSILTENGVEPFVLDVGTSLTPKHRREVQILERKGWGTKQHIERQFRPGEVVSIVRPGFRVGAGERSAILRKVEVLIKEAEG